MLAKMLSLQLGLEGLVGGLGVDGLLLEDGQDAHRLLEELEAGGQVHPEVASHPDDALAHVLLLLQDEHGAEIEIIFCSFTFLSYSTTHWLKNCCSFSLTRLMQICSKVLNSKISNPAMSRTPMNVTFFMVGS